LNGSLLLEEESDLGPNQSTKSASLARFHTCAALAVFNFLSETWSVSK
jgi:hypothetical protein